MLFHCRKHNEDAPYILFYHQVGKYNDNKPRPDFKLKYFYFFNSDGITQFISLALLSQRSWSKTIYNTWRKSKLVPRLSLLLQRWTFRVWTSWIPSARITMTTRTITMAIRWILSTADLFASVFNKYTRSQNGKRPLETGLCAPSSDGKLKLKASEWMYYIQYSFFNDSNKALSILSSHISSHLKEKINKMIHRTKLSLSSKDKNLKSTI